MTPGRVRERGGGERENEGESLGEGGGRGRECGVSTRVDRVGSLVIRPTDLTTA